MQMHVHTPKIVWDSTQPDQGTLQGTGDSAVQQARAGLALTHVPVEAAVSALIHALAGLPHTDCMSTG